MATRVKRETLGKVRSGAGAVDRPFTLHDASLSGHMHAAVQKVKVAPTCYGADMQVWTYVISSDDGSAPNYEPPFVTLSICKPRIRRKARPGQMVIAFNGSRLHPEPHSVRWAGIVREVIPLGAYWADQRFRNKRPDKSRVPDNIYRPSRGGLEQVKNPIHSAWNAATDIGGINTLVFGDWWYFSSAAPVAPQEFGLWMTGGRRHEPCRELDAKSWDALIAWLRATKACLGEIEIPRGGGDSCGGCGPPRAPTSPTC